jgi:tRNA G37 N-methylase Trm5/tRNA(Phe) wybutosine-synthesizing methylase Tyw3
MQTTTNLSLTATLAVADFDACKTATVSQVRANVNDRSRAGRVDDDVVPLVDSLNALRDFYTTSSCAGRIILVQTCAADPSRKYEVDWLAVTHDCAAPPSTHCDAFWQALTTQRALTAGFEVVFKMEAPIVTVCARDIHCAAAIAHVCRIAGVKRAAVTSLQDKIIVSIADTRKIEMLVALDGKLLVDRAYFDVAVAHALARLVAARQRLLQRFRRECVGRLALMPGAVLPVVNDAALQDAADDDVDGDVDLEGARTTATAAPSVVAASDDFFVLSVPMCAATDQARRVLQDAEFTHPELGCTKSGADFFVPLSGARAADAAVDLLRRRCAAVFGDSEASVVVHRVPAASVSHTDLHSTLTAPRALVFRARRAQSSTAHEQIVTRLQRSVASEALIDWQQVVPHKWEKLGAVVVVREWPTVAALRSAAARPLSVPACASALNALAEAIMHHLGVRSICVDGVGIGGELRQPNVRVVGLAGRALFRALDADADVTLDSVAEARSEASPTLTTHVENGISYSFDVRLCMFASGNGTERMHFASLRLPGETVLDMFAGIGYFSLPLAKHSQLARLICLEKNPDSVAFLSRNAAANGVAELMHILCGDNRVVGSEYLGQCDRVLMVGRGVFSSVLTDPVLSGLHSDAGRLCGARHLIFEAERWRRALSLRVHAGRTLRVAQPRLCHAWR